MNSANKTGSGVVLGARAWACALCAVLLPCGAALADSPVAPTSSVPPIEALIGDLGREYAMPLTTWGGAVPASSLQALQVFQETSERAASRAAMQELLKIGRPAVPQLAAALKTAEGRKAEAVAQILGTIGGQGTLYPLLRLADDPDQVLRARLAAAVGAAKQGDTSQWPLLLAGAWLSGERLLLSEALSNSKLPIGELDQARLQRFRQAQQEAFSSSLNAIRWLAPNVRAIPAQTEDVWTAIVALDKLWAVAHPFLNVETLADDPWQNCFWCERTLGTLSEYGPLIGEMRRLFIEMRLRTAAREGPVPLQKLMAELESISYNAEPFPGGSKEAERFSLSGYVRSGMLIQNYGYDRKTGAWIALDRVYVGVNSEYRE